MQRPLGAKVVTLDAESKQIFHLDLGAERLTEFKKVEFDPALAERLHRPTGSGAKVELICSVAVWQAVF